MEIWVLFVRAWIASCTQWDLALMASVLAVCGVGLLFVAWSLVRRPRRGAPFPNFPDNTPVVITVADLLVFAGFCSVSYGLYLYAPWVAFAAGGAILMALGLLGSVR